MFFVHEYRKISCYLILKKGQRTIQCLRYALVNRHNVQRGVIRFSEQTLFPCGKDSSRLEMFPEGKVKTFPQQLPRQSLFSPEMIV